jgi:uncharacterized sulfatase
MKPVLTLIALICLAPQVRAEAKPNVLFIAVDDMNNDLGCYGHPTVRSPNIDRLAKQGVRFDKAYCQYPICGASRTSVMTGLRPDKTRAFGNDYHFRKHLPDTVTLSQLFKNNGYHAARVGKIYHYGNPGEIGTDGLDDPASWNERFNPKGRDKADERLVINHTPKRGLGSSLSLLKAEGADEEQTDGIVATEAIRLMRENRDKPFFIAAGFYRPHCPYIAPKKYFDLYPLDQVPAPQGPFDEMKNVPAAARSFCKPWPWFGVTAQQSRESLQAYHAAISFVDAQVGRLLDAVERLGLADRTIIVFWSDHGYHVGEHGLWKKQSLFEGSARVPLIISAPGRRSQGAVSPRTVELLDLYPTLADLAGLQAPDYIEGTSLKPLLDAPEGSWERPAFTQVWRAGFPGHSVRTGRYRYTEWDGGKQGVELYDYESDPKELSNLARDPRHAATIGELKALVRDNWATQYRPGSGGRNPNGKKK